jgi:hypothetical protein
MNLVTIDTSPGNMSMYIAPNNTKYLELGKNASSIVIGPISQSGTLNVSTVINGVRIDNNTNTNNLLITQGNNKYQITSSGGSSNTCNTVVSNWAFRTNIMTGDHCTAVGHNCLTNNSTGNYNIAIGSDTLTNVTTGGYNTALGGLALHSLTTNSNSVAIGYGALQNFNYSVGGANIGIGYQALNGLTSGTGNLALGYNADNLPGSGNINTIGNSNTIIGNGATSSGYSNTIVIGSGAYANANNQIILGPGGGSHTTWIQGTGGLQVNQGSTSLQGLSAGTTSLGTTNTTNLISAGPRIMFSPDSGITTSVPASSAGLVLGWNYNTGQGETDFLNYSQGGATGGFRFYTSRPTVDASQRIFCMNLDAGGISGPAITANSDLRIKNIIRNITLDESIYLVNNLNPVIYNLTNIQLYPDDPNYMKKYSGYLAQDILNLGYDNLITKTINHDLEENTHNGYVSEKGIQYNLNYTGIIPYQGLVIKHLLKENEDLKTRLSAIEARLAAAGI